MQGKIERINPDGLSKNPAFSQAVTTQGSGKTIYIGGQNAVNANREIVGKGDIAIQTRQVMENIDIILKACGASWDNVLKFNIYMVQGQNLALAFPEAQKYLAAMKAPPAVSGIMVSGLANPDFLIEIEATAFIPEE